jgi:apurinic endonuclease APN1
VRSVGLHLRFDGSYKEVIDQALRLELPFFQCFLVTKSTGRVVPPSPEDIRYFVTMRRRYFSDIYIHGSYWINLSGLAPAQEHYALWRELRLAKQLECTHMVLHPGSAKGVRDKQEGICTLARALNSILQRERDISFVLENVAHGAPSVGGDLQDFADLLELLDQPDRISFCIDTAHAYAFGYDLAMQAGCDDFISLLGTKLGFNRIGLLHVNDSGEKLGSRLDKHAIPGHGKIGEQALKALVTHQALAKIPFLMELPVVSEQEEERALQLVRAW